MVKKGYGWSLRGTKTSRRRRRLQQRSSRYYAVAVGRRPGIFETWDDANKQVFRYPGAIHKSFRTLQEAFVYMFNNRLTPPGEREMWTGDRDTPRPSAALEEAYLLYWRQQERLQEQQDSCSG